MYADNSPIPSLLSSGCAELASLFQAFLAGEVLFPDHLKRHFQHLLPLQFIGLGRGWRGLCTVFLTRCIVALNDGLGGDGFALERVFLLHCSRCWPFPWLVLHWELTATWCPAGLLQADQFSSHRSCFLLFAPHMPCMCFE